jgi:NADH-quinone oxidoreductase B subunit
MMGLSERLVTWARVKSPWILHFNSGACNSCDIEVLAALIPTFDVERFGILLKATPRHADVLVCTGGVTKQQGKRLKRIYEQMPEPKFVIAMGCCGASGGVFKGCYSMRGGIDTVIPVTAYVPGCPPRPQAIIDGVVAVLGLIAGGGEPPEKPIVIGENGGVVEDEEEKDRILGKEEEGEGEKEGKGDEDWDEEDEGWDEEEDEEEEDEWAGLGGEEDEEDDEADWDDEEEEGVTA